MSRNEHDKFRDLFKDGAGAGKKEQTTVTVAGKKPGRSSASTNTTHGTASRDSNTKSSKSIKRKSTNRGVTPKKSGSAAGGARKKQSTATGATPSPASRSSDTPSNRRKSKSPNRVPSVAATPPTAKESLARTPTKKISTTAAKWNGKDVQEKTLFCPTVFENDGGVAVGGAAIEVAQSRIKERRLQWKKEEQPTSGAANDSSTDANCYVGARDEIKEQTKTTRTIFENDDNHPAPAGEEKAKLQWRSSGAQECMSEPEIRKKKSGDEVVRGAVSDRPPREPREAKPLRLPPPRTTVKTPPNTSTMTVYGSPTTRPVILAPTTGTTNTYAGEGVFGSGSAPSEKEERSCYLAPTMQQAEATTYTKKSDPPQINSEPYDSPKK